MIKGFIYGAFSSRFWILRKHINSIPLSNFKLGIVPFYAWECITIETKNRYIDLVIKDEDKMMYLIVYLINTLQKRKKNHFFSKRI